MERGQTIYIVDDDTSVGPSLARLLRAAGFMPAAFASIDELMATPELDANGCVIADVRMPRRNGLELKQLLAARGSSIPVILLTAEDTEALRAQAKHRGYAALFRKPVDDQALIDAIEWSLSRAV